MRRFVLIPFVLGLLLPGCAQVKRVTKSITGQQDAIKAPEIPAPLRGRDGGVAPLTRVSLEGEGGEAVPLGVAGAPLPAGLPSEDEIIWTDPDNPDAPLEGFEETLATARKVSGGWEVSYREATRRAVRDGKPLLIWFTDTQRSPLCVSLSKEVFSDGTFEAWANEHLVRLRIDFNVKGEDEDDTLRKEDYLEGLKKRYKVNGLPTVLVMAPDGTVTGRYKGYSRGSGDFYFGRIKNATLTAEEHRDTWRANLEKKGYRVWKNGRGEQIFARLLQYKNKELLLVEPSGKQLTAREDQLSAEDQEWIREELAKRGR